MARTECSGIFLVIRRFNNIEDTLEFANNLPVFTIYINMHEHLLLVISCNVHDNPLVLPVPKHADMTVRATSRQLNKGWVEPQTIYRTQPVPQQPLVVPDLVHDLPLV